MKKVVLSCLVIVFLLFGISAAVNATLITIGTADYDSNGDGTYDITDLNLIWDADNNGKSLVWLDYYNPLSIWIDQMSWVDGLSLTLNLYDGYKIAWIDTAWRLPSAGTNPIQSGYSNYVDADSEIGHLRSIELGFSGTSNTDQLKATIFDNLVATWYWSGTEYVNDTSAVWSKSMYNSDHGIFAKWNNGAGLAVRTGQVTYTSDPVPEPSTILLFGLGLLGFAGKSRDKKIS